MRVWRIATVAGDADAETRFATEAGSTPGLEVVMRCLERVELLAAMRSGQIDAVVLVGSPDWIDRHVLEELAERRLHAVRIAAGDDHDPARSAHGMATLEGAADPARVIAHLATAGPVPAPPASPPRDGGLVIAVWGPKGAPGATTVAVELAFVLARGEPDTLLLDADPYGGDVMQLLGVVEEVPTLLWAARRAARDALDRDTLLTAPVRVGPHGPRMLPGLARADLWHDISARAMADVLGLARTAFTNVVCDAGSIIEEPPSGIPLETGRNRMTRAVLDAADMVVAVCRADPTGLRSLLTAWGPLLDAVGDKPLRLILNRARRGAAKLAAAYLRAEIGDIPIVSIPDVGRDVWRSAEAGRAIAEVRPRSRCLGPLRALATGLTAAPATPRAARVRAA